MATITWDELTALEPRLLALLQEAEAIKDDKRKPSFCANAHWYGYGGHPGIKPRLLELVGWARPYGSAELRGTRAYDVAYETIYDALPDCRGDCSCA